MGMKWYVAGVGLAGFAFGFAMKVASQPEPSRASGSGYSVAGDGERSAGRVGVAVQPRRLRGPAAVESNELVTSADAMAALGYSNRQIFQKQQRDDGWASQVEALFRPELDRVGAELMPYAKDIALECRHSVCKLTMHVPATSLEEAYFLVQQVQLGSGLEPYSEDTPDESGHVVVGGYVRFTDATRAVDRVAVQYERLIAERFADGFPHARRWLDEHGMAGIRGEERSR